MPLGRRDAIKAGALGALGLGPGFANAAPVLAKPPAIWQRGFDNQRKADLGNGHFLNPVLSGDHPDPAVLKDGADYYLTFSSFDAYPGLTIWHSRDLVNWQPRGAALTRNIGSVWAVSLDKHQGRYFLYLPVKAAVNDIFVSWADHIDGPWSDPAPLGLHSHIDPCHAVGEDGSRWLFLSGGDRVRLADDGLSIAGAPEHVYDPWHYPDDWDVEGFSPEGPKIHRHGGSICSRLSAARLVRRPDTWSSPRVRVRSTGRGSSTRAIRWSAPGATQRPGGRADTPALSKGRTEAGLHSTTAMRPISGHWGGNACSIR
jgi:xylan 1,4-beta-xylosidase